MTFWHIDILGVDILGIYIMVLDILAQTLFCDGISNERLKSIVVVLTENEIDGQAFLLLKPEDIRSAECYIVAPVYNPSTLNTSTSYIYRERVDAD